MNTVSVVIPTFNRRPLLERALASVEVQAVEPLEVIVVDDGSTDDTAEVVAVRFPRVRYFRQENRGVSAARNRGIALASGEWVALLDSDDEWLPHKLERQLAALAEEPDYHLCHANEIWVRDGRRVNQGSRHSKSGGWIFQRCVLLCAISPSSSIIRREVFEEIGLFDEALPACEDYDFWLRFCSRYPVLFVDEPLIVKHGGRSDQLSKCIPSLDRYRIVALEKILAAGNLSQRDEYEVRRSIARRARIVAGGARKRGRTEEADRLLRRAREHESAVGG